MSNVIAAVLLIGAFIIPGPPTIPPIGSPLPAVTSSYSIFIPWVGKSTGPSMSGVHITSAPQTDPHARMIYARDIGAIQRSLTAEGYTFDPLPQPLTLPGTVLAWVKGEWWVGDTTVIETWIGTCELEDGHIVAHANAKADKLIWTDWTLCRVLRP
jgi:hypothetical protein